MTEMTVCTLTTRATRPTYAARPSKQRTGQAFTEEADTIHSPAVYA